LATVEITAKDAQEAIKSSKNSTPAQSPSFSPSPSTQASFRELEKRQSRPYSQTGQIPATSTLSTLHPRLQYRHNF
jgi:hypothetical protein